MKSWVTRRQVGSTACVHAGQGSCEQAGAATTPIVHSAPFVFGSTAELIKLVEGRSARTQPEYGRMGNPTVTCVERRLAAVEGAKKAQLFGGVQSLIEQVAVMSYWNISRSDREKMGMKDNLVRLSLGIEDAEDIMADLDQALRKV